MIDNQILKIIQVYFPSLDESKLVADELSKLGEILIKRGDKFSRRLQAAIVKYAEGDIQKFHQGINMARIDWRDILMNAGFGWDIYAHEKWIDQLTS